MEQATLTRTFALQQGLISPDAQQRPIKVVQFGEGNFLRAFVDWIIQQLNDANLFNGNVAIVQPLPVGRVRQLEEQDRLYTVILEGLRNGLPLKTHEVIDSIGQTVDVYADWQEFLNLADNPDLQIIVSNTTEAGIATSEEDSPQATPPKSYPAKLVRLLKRRYDDGLNGLLIVPCELIENNGEALKAALLETARKFGYEQEFLDWIEHNNTFVSTLVDRIVPGFPRDDANRIWNELGYRDDNMVKAEPFALWVVGGSKEAQRKVNELLPAKSLGIDLVTTDDVTPYRERKVFLLNAPHTTMALIARLMGLETVGQVMADDRMKSFIVNEMREEIMPVLSLPQSELDSFAHAVIERFSNPYNRHALDSIALNSVAKFKARLLPILERNVNQGRAVPRRIALALAALLVTYGHLTDAQIAISDDPAVLERFSNMEPSGDCVRRVLADTELWGRAPTAIGGLGDLGEQDVTALSYGNVDGCVAPLA